MLDRLDRRDKALILTGAWVLVLWGLLFTRNFPVIVIGFVSLAIPLALVFWQKGPWEKHQRVTLIVELVLVAPIVVLLLMTALQ